MTPLDATPTIWSIVVVKDPVSGTRTWKITYRATALGATILATAAVVGTADDIYSDIAGDAITAMVAAYGDLGYELPA